MKPTNKDIYKALKEVMQDLISKGHNVAYICVYGSQNYGMDLYTKGYQSDLDMKAVVIPTLDDMINNTKQTTFTQDTKFGQVDVKDIRLWVNNLKKANPSYIETLFTEYYLIGNTGGEEFIIDMRSIANNVCVQQHVQMVRAMHGMMKEKQKALCHPYPSIKHKIDQFGYDGKQLSHAIRLYDMMTRWISGEPMQDCLVPKEMEKAIMMHAKLQKFPLDEAKSLMDLYISEAKKITDQVVESGRIYTNEDYLKMLDRWKSEAIKQSIIVKIMSVESEYKE